MNLAMPAATNVQAKKKAGSTVREHLPGLAITRAIMQLIQASSNLTMSSREIAALTGKRHDNVVSDIRKMLSELVLGTPEFLGVYEAENGQQYECFNLPKRESLILISGYSIELRARIIDRWQELEAKQGPKLPTTMAEALRLAADQAEQIEKQQAALAIAAPKAAFVDQYVDASGLKGFRQVAKLLKANENHFRLFLIEKKVMYRLAGEWVAYQNHIDAGRFSVKTGEANGHTFTRSMFTPKGVEWVAGEFAKFQLAQNEEVPA